ncbi:MAG: hypothetical protein JWN44_2070 [Myxococcales bacterium]|nr:hypothetical protein [Myxococcales bacterium]
MKTHLLIPTMFLAACATTGTGAGGGSKSSAPFQGLEAVNKRRAEITDASKTVMDCLKSKASDPPMKGGIFAVTADATGKMTVTPVRWEGPADKKQCVVDTAGKTTLTPLPGPAVGALWEFMAPGEKIVDATVPKDLEEKLASLQMAAGAEVEACAQQNLPPDFPADTEVAFFVDREGQVYVPTVVKSTAKDGGYDTCVQGVVSKQKFPAINVPKPVGLTFRFHTGRLEKL